MYVATAPTLIRVEDREGLGTCGHCSREGLRWIALLTDGSHVGVECAKKVMGWKPTPKSYAWVADYTPVATHDDGLAYGGGRAIYTLWQRKQGTVTRETMNGTLTAIGGVRNEWIRRGWL